MKRFFALLIAVHASTMWPWQLAASAEPIRLVSDITYAVHGGTELKLDAYLPDAPGDHAAIVLIHGGRWQHGDKQDLARLAFAFVDEGFAVFSINYRLLPEWTYPAALVDAKAAVRWVRANAKDMNVDPGRIGALGGSAGAYLAAMLATAGGGSLTSGDGIAAAASWSGPLDLLPLLNEDDNDIPQSISAFLGCTDPIACETLAVRASPVTHADQGDAPLLVANGTTEVIPVEQVQSMADAYVTAGVPIEVLTPESASHGLGNVEAIFEPTLDFFNRWLGSPADDIGGAGDANTSAPPRAPSPSPDVEFAAPTGEQDSVDITVVLLAALVSATSLVVLVQAIILRSVRRGLKDGASGGDEASEG